VERKTFMFNEGYELMDRCRREAYNGIKLCEIEEGCV
jgi:hypothetical protein